MKNSIVILLLIFTFIIAPLLILGVFLNGIDNVGEEYNKMQEPIGTNYVLANDTLIIIDYSVLNNTYTLSNGTEISTELITKE